VKAHNTRQCPERHLSARASWLPAVPSLSWAGCGCATWTWGPKSGRALAPHGEGSAQLPSARTVAGPTTPGALGIMPEWW